MIRWDQEPLDTVSDTVGFTLGLVVVLLLGCLVGALMEHGKVEERAEVAEHRLMLEEAQWAGCWEVPGTVGWTGDPTRKIVTLNCPGDTP